ncbi:transcription elongation factor GreA [Candidatus Portiera aleyrodidarum]|uniref:Transcription elongation factor GreA n=1 Tax=Candidatus Portiera aleyrodidarum MED (Bemisia tabaci) TaxID=1163752 RepID=A0AAU8RQV1_9GAMM|nr:transcription elongation factor GreA [Candidatus Portiera aleyrodidarum]AFQ24146.1 transcription elongation factor GreA [Candidatus Portiera aleyrodidarum BT-B-HRs]AFS18908.1 Transcription elongation factor greA [Candidatus Portiera aleyrodidarum BT-QVLC]AFT80544.1 Transcription elongation factor GreA [Candidatus Portiera aleyrodidarum BT-QVLC]AFT80824.1 Transcription elongation factor GreA [Candidatus Portiera aleyrodidarum BT-B-HRs]AJF24122.1 transcription elongation factor GreA [Candidat
MMDSAKKIHMTKEGERQLKKELKKLKTIDRKKIIKDIYEARKHGDLKENAEYHSAIEQQCLLERRIKEIENKIANAHVIDITKIYQNGKIIFGTTVTLVNLLYKKKIKYKIVGEDEANIKKKKISITSPIARALIGKKRGDIVTVNTPGGVVKYEINLIEFL